MKIHAVLAESGTCIYTLNVGGIRLHEYVTSFDLTCPKSESLFVNEHGQVTI